MGKRGPPRSPRSHRAAGLTRSTRSHQCAQGTSPSELGNICCQKKHPKKVKLSRTNLWDTSGRHVPIQDSDFSHSAREASSCLGRAIPTGQLLSEIPIALQGAPRWTCQTGSYQPMFDPLGTAHGANITCGDNGAKPLTLGYKSESPFSTQFFIILLKELYELEALFSLIN